MNKCCLVVQSYIILFLMIAYPSGMKDFDSYKLGLLLEAHLFGHLAIRGHYYVLQK